MHFSRRMGKMSERARLSPSSRCFLMRPAAEEKTSNMHLSDLCSPEHDIISTMTLRMRGGIFAILFIGGFFLFTVVIPQYANAQPGAANAMCIPSRDYSCACGPPCKK